MDGTSHVDLSSGDPPIPERATAWFAAEPSSVSAARDFAAVQIRRWRLSNVCCVASLIVSELTTNAVRHARSRFELDLSHVDGTVRIAVSDESSAPPVLRDLNVESGSGRGLRIVAGLASEWGFELGGGGKQVWARVPGSHLAGPSTAPGISGQEEPGMSPANGHVRSHRPKSKRRVSFDRAESSCTQD